MTKQEFLDTLKMALSTRVGATVVAENVNYYEDYINSQIRMGNSEEQVIAQLGDPRLLARSIAEANKHAGIGGDSEDAQSSGNEESGHAYGYGPNSDSGYTRKTVRTPAWLIILIVFFVIFLVIGMAFSLLSVFAPIIIPVILIGLLIRVLRQT